MKKTLTPPPPYSKLVHYTDSEGYTDTDPRFEEHSDGLIEIMIPPEVLEQLDPHLVRAATELAERLALTYSEEFRTSLMQEQYPQAVSTKIGAWVIRRGMDMPRVSIMAPEDLEQHVDIARMDDSYYLEGVRLPRPDSVVINFRLPSPLEQFWHRSQRTEFPRVEEPASWGNRYRVLADVPWNIIEAWQYDNPKYKLDRLNDLGEHRNGEGGYYYLFEVASISQDTVLAGMPQSSPNIGLTDKERRRT